MVAAFKNRKIYSPNGSEIRQIRPCMCKQHTFQGDAIRSDLQPCGICNQITQLDEFREVASNLYLGNKKSENEDDSKFSFTQLITDLKKVKDKRDERDLKQQAHAFDDSSDGGQDSEDSEQRNKTDQYKKSSNKQKRKTDGFLEYGVSIENFFNLEWMLIKLFFWLTILSIPQLIVYAKNWSPPDAIRQGNILAQLSFGGLGQANNICGEGSVQNSGTVNTEDFKQTVTIPLSCDSGYYVQEVFSAWHVSLLAKESETHKEADYDQLTHICDYRDDIFETNTYKLLNKTIIETCGQNSTCNPVFDITKLNDTIPVWNDDTIFYAIVACKIIGLNDGPQMTKKREFGLLVAVIGLFMCVFFRFTITYMQNELDFEEKMLDHQLVSVDDYTITGSIPKDLYQRILRQTEFVQAATHDDTNPDEQMSSQVLKPIKRFEEYLKTVILKNLEYQMKKKAKQDKQAAEDKGASKVSHSSEKSNFKEKSRIVEIAYAFENRSMLRSLIALNKELAALTSILPGCCSRLLTRRGLRQKVVAQKSLLATSLNEETEKKNKAKHKSCKAWCKAQFCGLREDFDEMVTKYVDQEFECFELAKQSGKIDSLDREQLEQLLKNFYLIYDINIELDKVKIDELADKIDTSGDKLFQKTELVVFIKDTISTFQSNFANMDAIEEDMCMQKERNFLSITNPKHFWVTFMEGEAAQQMQELRRIDLNKHPQEHLRIKRKINVKRAKSPSDIIWKNVGYAKWKLVLWLIVTGLIVFLVGCCAQLLFASEISAQMYIGYRVLPPGVNCEQQLNSYTPEVQKYLSAIEILRIRKEKEEDPGVRNLNDRISKLGILPCFCQKEHLKGFSADKNYTISQLDDLSIPLCKQQMKFQTLFGVGQNIYYGLSLAIVIQSYIFRFLFSLLAKKVRVGTQSNRLSFMIISSFVIFFINYGLAYALGPIKAQIPFLENFSLDISVYYDFNQSWFTDIGELVVLNAAINALMPFVEDFFMVWMPDFIYKILDNKCLCCLNFCSKCSACCRRNNKDKIDKEQKDLRKKHYRTGQKTLFGFQDLYSGPEFEIHYKYAYMLTTTWVTFLFAPGMPLMFPIALIGLLILYSTNQYMLARQCKKPPVYDETMTRVTLKLLKFAPYLYAMMGAWLFSNQQTFYNVVTYNQKNELMMPTQHHIDQFWKQATPGSVFFVYLLIGPAWIVLRWVLQQMCGNCVCQNMCRDNKGGQEANKGQSNGKLIRCCNQFSQSFRHMMTWCRERSGDKQSDSIQQRLPSFYATLSDHERNSLICDEVENYSRLQIKTLTLENLLYLIFMPKEEDEKLQLQGQSSYRMLRQPIAERFNYISQPGYELTPEDFVVSPYGNSSNMSNIDYQKSKDDAKVSSELVADDKEQSLQLVEDGKKKEEKQVMKEKNPDEIRELKRCQLDVVRATANLAYIPPKLALRIRFSPGFIKLYKETNNDQNKDYEAETDVVKKHANHQDKMKQE